MTTKPEFWAVEDAAAFAGVTRQRLNELLRLGRYPSIAVPYRPPREDSIGRDRDVRFRVIEGEVVQRIKKERGQAAILQADRVAAAQKRRAQPKVPSGKKRGRPRKHAGLASFPL